MQSQPFPARLENKELHSAWQLIGNQERYYLFKMLLTWANNYFYNLLSFSLNNSIQLNLRDVIVLRVDT